MWRHRNGRYIFRVSGMNQVNIGAIKVIDMTICSKEGCKNSTISVNCSNVCIMISQFLIHLRQRQDHHHFVDDILKIICLYENGSILFEILLKFDAKGMLHNKPPLDQIMDWRRTGEKPFSELVMAYLLKCICSYEDNSETLDAFLPGSMDVKTSSKGNVSALLALCAGNSPMTGEFPPQRSVTRSFGVFFDHRLHKRLNKQSRRLWFETQSSSLWRHCNGWSNLQMGMIAQIGTKLCGKEYVTTVDWLRVGMPARRVTYQW